MSLAPVVDSLELLAERDIDPTRAVYARLFARYPEMEALFVRDQKFIVRGQMVQMVMENLLDYATDRTFGLPMIQAERVNHVNLGVPNEVFGIFFGVIRETIAELLGDGWTPAMAQAWATMLARLETEIVD